jgi:hypothetical protein
MIYELREYLAVEGRSAALHSRFADHTLALFERHGLEVAGFWTDHANDGRILYLLRFPDDEAHRQAWTAFGQDPDWKSVKEASEADGPIVAEMHSTILTSPAYWPHVTVPAESATEIA